MIGILRILGTYGLGGIAGLAIYVAMFALPIGGEILFYRGIVLAVLTAAVLGALLALFHVRLGVDTATAVGIVLTGLALNVSFLVLFPVTIDRSISVFLLSRIAAEQPLDAAQLQQRFADEYLGRMEQIPRRVHEQSLSGNIAVAPGGAIRLTPRGEKFVALAKAASVWFHTDRRFVDPAADKPAS
jgi:hypothetical protein